MTRPDATLEITPLGGLGEFGMNCMLMSSDGTRVMIDCGVMFPEPEHFGVDLLVPDFDCLRDRSASGRCLDALVLTHGHEDHIGAVPFLVKAIRRYGERAKLPIYATPFTMALTRRKLEEHELMGFVDLHVVECGGDVDVDPFNFEFVRVNHSIPDCAALAIDTPRGLVVHTADWRIDHTPIGEPIIDLPRFGDLGRQGVLLMLADSTNAERPGATVSEKRVGEELTDVLDLAPGRVIITQFSSNIWRLQSVLHAAHETNRKVVLAGRSLRQNLAAARELGRIKLPSDDIIVDADDLKGAAAESVVIVASGSQGEPYSTLTRMAFGDHGYLDVRPGDWVVYSSRKIPGNEKKIARVVDALIQRGARVLEPTAAQPLHTSGHAQSDEMKTLLNLVRPKHFIPVHGSFRQLAAHAKLARSIGLDAMTILDGDQVRIDADDELTVAQSHIATTYQFVIGPDTGFADGETLRQRRQIGFAGMIVAIVVLSRARKLRNGPTIIEYGTSSDSGLLERAGEAARRALVDQGDLSDLEEVAETMRLAIRRSIRRETGRKPVVIPKVIWLDPEDDDQHEDR